MLQYFLFVYFQNVKVSFCVIILFAYIFLGCSFVIKNPVKLQKRLKATFKVPNPSNFTATYNIMWLTKKEPEIKNSPGIKPKIVGKKLADDIQGINKYIMIQKAKNTFNDSKKIKIAADQGKNQGANTTLIPMKVQLCIMFSPGAFKVQSVYTCPE